MGRKFTTAELALKAGKEVAMGGFENVAIYKNKAGTYEYLACSVPPMISRIEYEGGKLIGFYLLRENYANHQQTEENPDD